MTTSEVRTRQTIPVQRTSAEGTTYGTGTGKTGGHAGFRPDIEGLRAVAVTLVVLAHAGLPFLAGGYGRCCWA